MALCKKELPVRGKYKNISEKKCYLMEGHEGPCSEFPYLEALKVAYPRVANKIVRDATKTTGASWKSDDAGPNRIDRWVMLESDEVLASYGLNMKALKPSVVAKLREKAATYDDCMDVAAKLTWLVYQMPDAPDCEQKFRTYLEKRFGDMGFGSTTCIVCRQPLSFSLFEKAKRGKAEIETAHSNPREHSQDNVGFAHRECNIAQGNKTLDEFYQWARDILSRVEAE
ncbi:MULTISPECIES: hypothetical protein [Aeromonas]|uniref:hypothetical protein n=1 Tax=Aeromonas TaxID=642 RepID=UPI0012EA204C|nr:MULTISPECIES: hypothetical protein [Aeromonas]MCF5850440.1 hypothetical protein [Aeromonas veronii]